MMKRTSAPKDKHWSFSIKAFAWGERFEPGGMSSMSDKTFVDTHVLICAHDLDAQSKCDSARRILRELWSERSGVLSPQVLQEFYVNVTRKIKRPLNQPAARQVVSSYAIWCVDTTPSDISVAFRIEDEHRIGS